MSVTSSNTQQTTRRGTLTDLLSPMQFKAVLLFAYGLSNCQIAQVLGTTEHVVKNAIRYVYKRAGCHDSGELACRYFREVADGLLELGRLRRELAELDSRVMLILHGGPGDLLRRVN